MTTSASLNKTIPLEILSKKSSLFKVLNVLYLTRFMDSKMEKLVKQNKGTTFFLSVAGHELVGAVASQVLIPGRDWAFPYYRDRAFVIGYGCSLGDLFGAFLARRVDNHSGGRMMPDHFSHKGLKIPCQSSCVGSQFLSAVGVAKGIKLRKAREVVYVSSGEGATSQGDFHEALNFSCIHNLPIVFVVQDNNWAISVNIKEQTAGGSIVHMAKGYSGLSVYEVDGTDYEQLFLAIEKAVTKARKDEGPSLIVTKVARLNAHSNSDDPSKYKSREEMDRDKLLDPILSFEKWLKENGVVSEEILEEMRRDARSQIELEAKRAEDLPFPRKETASTKIFIDFEVDEEVEESSLEPIVMMDAISHALQEEMERDKNVLIFGEDVAHNKGGVFRITQGLTKRFGIDRCFNTPLAESTIIGLAIGLSMNGVHKPIAEIQFADYIWPGMNQLVNELSSICYRSDGQWHCPLVIRIPYGGYIQGGPYHSQSIEGFLTHIPGLKVAVPSNAADAKMLLKSAIRDPNPVVFLEHKALYRRYAFCARPETGKNQLLPFGRANIVQEGEDLTFIGWGMMVVMANEVAEKLKEENISVEVIDLRTLVPLDMETILNSVKKTGRVIIAHEASKNCGFGAELAARIVEEGFTYLDAPIIRVAGKNCPVPYCVDLENEVLPQKKDIEKGIKDLISF